MYRLLHKLVDQGCYVEDVGREVDFGGVLGGDLFLGSQGVVEAVEKLVGIEGFDAVLVRLEAVESLEFYVREGVPGLLMAFVLTTSWKENREGSVLNL